MSAKLNDDQWAWLRSAATLPEGKAYSSDNQDHDALFDQKLIEAYPLNQTDWYGACVRLTPAGVRAVEAYDDICRLERTRIVAKIRDIATRFRPRSASQNNHRALARAIESGHAFAEGNPK